MFNLVDYGTSPVRKAATAVRYGEFRAKRLRKIEPTGLAAWAIDLAYSIALPGGIGVGIAALAMAALQIDAVDDWVKNNPISPQVITSLSTLVAFIVSLRLGQNLNENAASINAFNDVCGSATNIAIWSRSLVSKDEFQYLTLPDGKGGFYQTTRLGLILASVPFVVKYTYRGRIDIPFETLPIGGDAALLARANDLTTSRDGFTTVSPFTALLMMIGEYVHLLEDRGEIKPGELGALFKQIDALTAAEGKISGSVSFSYPRILRVLLYGVFFAWLALLSLTEIAPSSEWNSLWLVALLSLSSVGLYSMSNRYAVMAACCPFRPLQFAYAHTFVCPWQNPFQIRSKNSTQTPLISIACKQAETAIDGIFSGRGNLKALAPSLVR